MGALVLKSPNESEMAAVFKKLKIRYIFTPVWSMVVKFGTLIQNKSVNSIGRKNSVFTRATRPAIHGPVFVSVYLYFTSWTSRSSVKTAAWIELAFGVAASFDIYKTYSVL